MIIYVAAINHDNFSCGELAVASVDSSVIDGWETAEYETKLTFEIEVSEADYRMFEYMRNVDPLVIDVNAYFEVECDDMDHIVKVNRLADRSEYDDAMFGPSDAEIFLCRVR